MIANFRGKIKVIKIKIFCQICQIFKIDFYKPLIINENLADGEGFVRFSAYFGIILSSFQS